MKFYEGLDLAHAYVATGDGDYLTAWEDLVESFCYQVPVGHDTSDVSARRLQNWLYAWQRFAADPDFAGLRPGLEDLLVSRITADAAHLRDHLTAERNHRTLELYALLLVALAFDDSRRRPVGARPARTPTRPPTSGPTASSASAAPTTTSSCCARSSARSPTPAASAWTCRRRCCTPPSGPASSRCTCSAPTG